MVLEIVSTIYATLKISVDDDDDDISGTACPIFPNFLCRSPVAMTRSSSGGVAMRYVILVLWMTSHLAVMDMAIAVLQYLGGV